MKPERMKKWRLTRAKGIVRYVLFSGILSYGLACFVVVTFILQRNDLSQKAITTSAMIWAGAGAVLGLILWFIQEREYRNAV